MKTLLIMLPIFLGASQITTQWDQIEKLEARMAQLEEENQLRLDEPRTCQDLAREMDIVRSEVASYVAITYQLMKNRGPNHQIRSRRGSKPPIPNVTPPPGITGEIHQ